MTQTIEATYENGVFVPTHPPALTEHDRVRLIVESIPSAHPQALATLRTRRADRLSLDPALAADIALAPEFDLLDTP